MSTVQFASDQIQPVRSNTAPGGVFSTRNASKTSSLGAGYHTRQDDIEEEGVDLKQEGDIKHKQVRKGIFPKPCCIPFNALRRCSVVGSYYGN